ncbi:MAG: hypothetical protein WAW61_04305 [Methylococcaceae bacterium]
MKTNSALIDYKTVEAGLAELQARRLALDSETELLDEIVKIIGGLLKIAQTSRINPNRPSPNKMPDIYL